MKQSLQLKMGQSLTMTPQLQQAIRLLQLSTLDLQNEIQEALDSNPMLEMAEELIENKTTEQNSQTTPKDKSDKNNTSQNTENTATEPEGETDSEWTQDIPSDLPVDISWDDVYQSTGAGNANNRDDDDFEHKRGGTESLQDHLLWQLNLTPFSDLDRLIAMTLIDDLQDNGLLSSPIATIYEGLAQQLDELELDEVITVLHRIQQFDPPGVAAQDLSECLLIQLRQLNPDTPGLDTAMTIVKEYIHLLGAKDYKSLLRKLHLKEDALKTAIQLIQALNPHPGDDIGSGNNTEYVVPDVFVKKTRDRWVVELNPDIAPKLRINSGYASMVKRADASTDNTFLKDNLQEARWFLKSLQSRNETLLKVASAIVEKQQGFLDHGEEAMRPLVLHDVADSVDMHESTISRVTTNKYMHTPQGIFELKYFFSSHVSTDTGGECSSTAIRAIIKKLIASENGKKPLSDSKITVLLADQGIKVARRTIAKYRESMNIPPSNERKQLV
ncbi:MAG: RNA polymerase factor sigma-54 [Cellvibrionaceae bacterium]|nr:RNA polymerase factor sigma-54 [Cellvibrionaceae bacterium]